MWPSAQSAGRRLEPRKLLRLVADHRSGSWSRIALRNEELMFEAPEAGYQPSWALEIGVRDASYEISKTVKFYLRTADGKYAAMRAEIVQMGIAEAEVNLSAYINPSGSRNLQYDASKRIAPR